jgi:hypothetical protein
MPAAAAFLNHASAPFIKKDDNTTTTWSTMAGKFSMNKTCLALISFPGFNIKKQMNSSWAFHEDFRSDSSSTYDMIIGQDLLGESGIIMNFISTTIRLPGILTLFQ